MLGWSPAPERIDIPTSTGVLSNTPGAVLVAEQLGKRYGRSRVALQHIDLAIQPGRVTALVGPNGAGKSTLLKIWVGFERPSSGRASVNGIEPSRDRGGALRQIAYVPQLPLLYRELTVADHLEWAAHLRRGFDRNHARARLEDLAIAPHRRASELSGGQSAQVVLALALGTRAPILLLDEPLASLDPLARSEFLDVLRTSVSRDGITAVLSSHVVRDIEQGCDWLTVLGVGRVLFDGALASAQMEHVVVDTPSTAETSPGFVAQLPAGSALIRVSGRRPRGNRDATLEEIVLGYLVRGRATA
jgi:ABC-2 type transport system ATP-binding protein